MASTKKVAIVTGGNKGIGLATVRQLCKSEFAGDVILTARSEERGVAACRALEEEGLHAKFHQLEVTDQKSVENLRDYLQREYGGLDILVNNAGIYLKKSSPLSLAEKARETIKTNFTGPLIVFKALSPLLRAHARVVNVSSVAGLLKQLDGSPKQSAFAAPTLTEEQLVSLLENFVSSSEKGTEKEDGWPENAAYVVSKLGLIALTKVQSRQLQSCGGGSEDILVNAVCPGWVNTDMTSDRAPLTPDQGAETSVHVALLPAGSPTGEFFKDKTLAEW